MDQQGGAPEKNDKGYDVIVNITNDYYNAYVNVEIHDVGAKITEKDVLDALKAKNVTYGIDMDAVEYVVQNPETAKDILIATGIHHENGKDAEITFFIDKETHVQPKMLSDGRVNFKEIDSFITVMEGDILASKTEPTPGKDGMTITGREIKGKQGKVANFKAGRNVRISEDGSQLIADKSGNVQFDGDRVTILEVLEHRGDVGPKTGNIHFMGKVTVYGNVLSGYEVISDNDVEINGIVECARIEAKGNLIINGGVQGNDQAELFVDGELEANFLNNCHAQVKGNIKCDAVLHCHITCDGSIIAEGRRGMVVGGELNVRKEIRAKVVGSEMGTLTKVRMGVDSKIMDDFKNVADQIKETQESIAKITQAQRMIRKQMEANHSAELKVMLDKTTATLIQNNDALRQQQEQLRELNILIDQLRDARIMAQTVYPGVKVRIGNSFYNVKDTLQSVRIQKDEGDIRLLPY